MRLKIIKLWVIIASLVFVSTEFLSALDFLTPFWIRLFWASVLGTALYGSFATKTQRTSLFTSFLAPVRTFRQLPRSYRILVVVSTIFVILPLFFLAIYAPPNNVDSINYHLTRVVCWLQNHNVKHYPTFHVQQLYHNVMSEYLLLHVLALSGTDYFLNLVQWSAMIGTVFGIGLISKELGFSLQNQVIVGVLQLSLPIGILEASTTQNDYVATFFFISFLYFGLKILDNFTWNNASWMILSLAWGGFTKYPIFFYAFPYCLWIGFQLLKKQGLKVTFSLFCAAFLCLILVFMPFFWRNYQLFNNILSPSFGHPLFVENIATERHGLLYPLSNAVKNTGLHLGLPNSAWNAQIDNLITHVHQLIGISINDSLISLDIYRTQFVIQEDMSGNFLMFISCILASIWLLFQKGHSKFKGILICTIIGFLIFCTAAKFQLWSSRTHMPLFAQGVILVGLFLSKLPKNRKVSISFLFVLAALPYVINNFNKPLIPIRYASKYLLGYIPRHLCVSIEDQESSYQNVLGTAYDFEKREPCFPLKANPTYSERRDIVAKLGDLGYYQKENEHIFKHSREHYFFITDKEYPSTYSEFTALAKLIPQATQTVGLLFNKKLGFYHYWSILNRQLPSTWEMKYVLCHKEYLALPNASRIFAYEYVFCDDERLIDKYMSKDDIAAIYRTKSLVLLHLKRPSSKYYFITQ
ncbi:hypothetical protein [Runella sp.]|jgi:hypothetical protein|uniref:hypothetical protein n=1 Tax=Runella sp. TaxID=1960881 RepID=UPI00260C9187|nr:hypothetical protein [Runella sp.]